MPLDPAGFAKRRSDDPELGMDRISAERRPAGPISQRGLKRLKALLHILGNLSVEEGTHPLLNLANGLLDPADPASLEVRPGTGEHRPQQNTHQNGKHACKDIHEENPSPNQSRGGR